MASNARRASNQPAAADTGVAESAAGVVFFGIVNALEAYRLVPGQRLVEAELALHFGVGRNSVREGLQRLAAEGIVEIVRHKGAVIRSLTMDDTRDVLDVAERITGLLARRAARGVARGQSTAPLSHALAGLDDPGHWQDVESFARARRLFYRALLELGGSRELRRLFPSIHMPIVYAQHRPPGLQKLRLRDYCAIGKAVLAGDEAAADEAGARHVRNVRDEILRTLKAAFPGNRTRRA